MSAVSRGKKKVCIALSGGVDSAVAAYLLQQEGYEVIAGFIKVWQPDFLPCSQEEDRVAAKRVAAALGIPFYVVDLADEYKKGIVEYMVDSYTRGETPNPDVMCNKVIKFGALWEWAKAQGCDFIATGHHAQVLRMASHKTHFSETEKFTTSFSSASRYRAADVLQSVSSGSPLPSEVPVLVRGADPAKDQAYFLWELTNDDLAHVLLPIGHMQKSEVRKVAEQANLPSASRKDSQGLCFLGALTMSDFLEHLIENKKGEVRSEKGEVVGEHNGTHLFTLGQRGGFTLAKANKNPLYVVGVDAASNVVTVAESIDAYRKNTYTLRSVVLRQDISTITHTEMRYHGEKYSVVSLVKNISQSEKGVGDTYTITLAEPSLVSPGQSCVLYAEQNGVSICVGGGIICAE